MKTKLALLALLLAVSPQMARAHCDTTGGPVAQDVRAALASGDVTPVLKWIKPGYEAELRDIFARTLRVRKQGSEAAALADRYFLETAVRLHRAGEGAPYEGVKDAPVPAEIAAADQALEKGDATALADELSANIAAGVHQRFAVAAEKRKHANDSVAAGREYVAAYVDLMHYLEAVQQLAERGPEHGSEHAHR